MYINVDCVLYTHFSDNLCRLYKCGRYTKLYGQHRSATNLQSGHFAPGDYSVFFINTFQNVCDTINIRLMVIPHWHKPVEQVRLSTYNNSLLIG